MLKERGANHDQKLAMDFKIEREIQKEGREKELKKRKEGQTERDNWVNRVRL